MRFHRSPLESDGRVIIRRRLSHDAEESIRLRGVEPDEVINSLHLHVGVLLDSLRPFLQTLCFEGFQLRALEQAFHHRVQPCIGAVIAHRLHQLQVGGVVAGNEIVPFFRSARDFSENHFCRASCWLGFRSYLRASSPMRLSARLLNF